MREELSDSKENLSAQGETCGDAEMPFPLVTAIITTHDRLNYLKCAVRSMLEQTWPNMEYIVVNDNSGKDTTDYLNDLQSRIANFRHIYISAEEHKNGNYARNLGIKAAKGKYVAFLDDDDEWFPEKTEKQVKLFKDGVGLVYCGRVLEHVDGIHEPWREDAPIDIEYVGDLSQKCFGRIFCTTSAMMADRAVMLRAGCFDEDLKFWQETEFCIRACQITLVDAVNEPLIILRLDTTDSGRLTNKYEGWRAAVAQINEKHKELIEALPPEYKKQRREMIFFDGLERQLNSGLINQRQKLYEIWKWTHNPKDFIKFVLNRPRLRPQKTAEEKKINNNKKRNSSEPVQ